MDAEPTIILDWFFAPLAPFVWHPERIAIIAGLFFVAAVAAWFRRKKIAWPIIVAGLAWALFSPYESHCKAQGYNIRVDLLLIYPVLLVLTLWGIAEAIVPGCSTRPLVGIHSRLLRFMVTILAVVVVLWVLYWWVLS